MDPWLTDLRSADWYHYRSALRKSPKIRTVAESTTFLSKSLLKEAQTVTQFTVIICVTLSNLE